MNPYNLPHQVLRPHQEESILWANNWEKLPAGTIKVTEQSTGCHAEGQGILMYDGSVKKVEDVIVGDLVTGWNGYNAFRPRYVEVLHYGYDRLLRVETLDGKISFDVNSNHILTVVTKCGRVLDGPIQYWLAQLYDYDDAYSLLYFDTKERVFVYKRFMINWLEKKEKPYYGFTLEGDPHYLMDNGILTHNSGKSHVAMAQAYIDNTGRAKVVALTKSKNLQQQYGSTYQDCAVLFGRGNYPCVHPMNQEGATTADCLYDNRADCYYYRECPYVMAKNRALGCAESYAELCLLADHL